MTKKNIVMGVVIVILIALVGITWYFKAFLKNAPEYSVVYLSTGEVYVGELSMFPNMELRNGYILATAPDAADPSKSNFQLNPLSEALWAPKHLYFNKEQVVFYGPLLSNSRITETLAAQKK